MGKYIKIQKAEKQNPKTEVWEIVSEEELDIAEIKWYGAWRKYCFFPEPETVFCTACLTEITNFIFKLNQNHRNKRKANK